MTDSVLPYFRTSVLPTSRGPNHDPAPKDRLRGPREVIPLPHLAADLAHRLELTGGLDALGHHIETERVGQLRDRAGEGGARAAVAGPGDERLVHLHHVEGEPAEVAERRVARAEVIEGEPHPGLAQFVKACDPHRRVRDQHGLGDLHDELVRGDSRLVDRGAYAVDQAALLELRGRRVHMETDWSAFRMRQIPVAREQARLAEHETADRRDQPRLL